MTSPREGAICAALMLGWFALLMTFGFHLRFGAYPWELAQ